jgi:large subunit ribosomal protein L37Ae
MPTKTKKSRHAGRFGAGYGKTVKDRLNKIEDKQRKKQKCPFCKKLGAKRLSKGIWKCSKCNKKFAGGSFHLK